MGVLNVCLTHPRAPLIRELVPCLLVDKSQKRLWELLTQSHVICIITSFWTLSGRATVDHEAVL